MKTITFLVAASLILSIEASAQWATRTDTTIARTRDGKPDLSSPSPKASDGKPDLSGVWTPELDPNALPKGATTVESITGFIPPRHIVDITSGMKPEDVQTDAVGSGSAQEETGKPPRGSSGPLRPDRRSRSFRYPASLQNRPDAEADHDPL